MISVDFRERRLGSGLEDHVRRLAAITLDPAMRGIFVAGMSLTLLIGVESTRLTVAYVRAMAMERQRDELVSQVRQLDDRLVAISEAHHELRAAREIRATNVVLAGKIARLGNALSPATALLALRASERSWSIEGQTESLADLQETLHRLELLSRFEIPDVFELHRNEVGTNLAFRVQFNPSQWQSERR